MLPYCCTNLGLFLSVNLKANPFNSQSGVGAGNAESINPTLCELQARR